MVDVFRLFSILYEVFSAFKINFNLADCDKVLKVEGENIKPLRITLLVKNNDFEPVMLEE